MRFLLRTEPDGARIAKDLIDDLLVRPNHEFWPDSVDYSQIHWGLLVGHQQVTDAYLVSLAASRGRNLVTLDQALAAIYPNVILMD